MNAPGGKHQGARRAARPARPGRRGPVLPRRAGKAGGDRQDGVEYHPSHICTKPGITSRTALIGRLSDLRE
ncbi:hypothetical protein [Nonomuraea salmonea]|uniref:hypothetical protein n=1 Tax=Nonomuraea salmonea TaxID=46181 RepID=UPI0031E580F4